VSEAAASPPRLVQRVRWATGATVLVAIAFSQAPGRIVADTKLDLVVDPSRFLSRALQAWDPQASFGQLQNQAYGYLFPMGPFFWVAHELRVPAWAAQRLWWSVLLVGAYAGLGRLARELRIGTPDTRIIAALAYALSPRVLSELGSISVEALPLAVLPWVVVPLVSGSRQGSPRRAAARSGVALLFAGGVNAAAASAVLVVPVLFLLSRAGGSRRRALAGWWALAVLLATAWWALPLLVLGRYAYPFLSLIETASLTTAVTSVSNVLRGTDHWIAFLVGPLGAQWPAGFELAAVAIPAAATVLVAGTGLAGLADRRTPERRFLGWCALAGTVLVGAGYAGAAGAPAAGAVQRLLDGPLAAYRNVHKFDPVLRVAVVLGLAAALAGLPRVVRWLGEHLGGDEGRWVRGHPRGASATGLALVLLPVVLATAPAWTGSLAPRGSFAAIPAYWRQTADWLAGQPGRALLEPASRFGEYTWGRPEDEPLQALARSPWAVRGAVPLGAPGATRLLDGFEAQLSTGVGSPGLAAALHRAGVGLVVLRNDLAADAAATPPAVVRAALAASPGISLAASFGPLVSTAGGLDDVSGTLPRRPAVEVFRVGSPPPRAQLLTGQPVGLSGGPEALTGDIAVDPGTPYVARADGGPVDPMLVTDTLRRRLRDMGADSVDAYGPTLPASSEPARGRPAADVLPYAGTEHQTTTRLIGAAAVTASSSAADPFAKGYLGPAYDPYAAVDGDPATAWVAARGRTATWRVDLGRQVRLTRLLLVMAGSPATQPRAVSVRSAAGRWSGPVEGQRVSVPLPAGDTSWVSIRLTGDGPDAQPGLAEVLGLPPISRTVVVPADSAGAGPGTRWAFTREAGARRACIDSGPGWACVPESSGGPPLLDAGPEPGPLDRTFTVSASAPVRLAVTVTPRQGGALDALLDAASGETVSGSSRLVADSAARPGAAVDGDPRTAWLPAATDPAPSLGLRYARPVTVTGLRLQAPRSTLGRVTHVVVATAAGTRTGTPGPDGRLAFAPLGGRTLRVTLHLRAAASGAAAPQIDELDLTGAPAPVAGDVRLGCGSGPTVRLDGVSYQTALVASGAAVLGGQPLPARVCGASATVLGPGEHRLVATSSPAFDVAGVALDPTTTSSSGVAEPLPVQRWAPEHRVVSLPGAGGLLVLDEGFNPGWSASVRGRALVPVRVDGWRQAWRVPDGLAGAAVLTYRPGDLQRAGLGAGVVAVLLLLALATAPARRAAAPAVADGHPVRGERTTLALLAAVVLTGGAGLAGWALGRFVLARRAVPAIAVGTTLLACLVGIGVAGAHPWWVSAATQVVAITLLVTATTAGPAPGSGDDGPG